MVSAMADMGRGSVCRGAIVALRSSQTKSPAWRGASVVRVSKFECLANSLAKTPAAVEPFAVSPEAALVPVAASGEIEAVRIAADIDRRCDLDISLPRRAGGGMVETEAVRRRVNRSGRNAYA